MHGKRSPCRHHLQKLFQLSSREEDVKIPGVRKLMDLRDRRAFPAGPQRIDAFCDAILDILDAVRLCRMLQGVHDPMPATRPFLSKRWRNPRSPHKEPQFCTHAPVGGQKTRPHRVPLPVSVTAPRYEAALALLSTVIVEPCIALMHIGN